MLRPTFCVALLAVAMPATLFAAADTKIRRRN